MNMETAKHFLNVVTAQRNEAMDRHAEAVAQINVFMEAAAEREKESQASIAALQAEVAALKAAKGA